MLEELRSNQELLVFLPLANIDDESWTTNVYMCRKRSITKLCGTCIAREGDSILKHISMLILPTHILVTVSTCVVWIGSLVGHEEGGTVTVKSYVSWLFLTGDESWILDNLLCLLDVSNSYGVSFWLRNLLTSSSITYCLWPYFGYQGCSLSSCRDHRKAGCVLADVTLRCI